MTFAHIDPDHLKLGGYALLILMACITLLWVLRRRRKRSKLSHKELLVHVKSGPSFFTPLPKDLEKWIEACNNAFASEKFLDLCLPHLKEALDHQRHLSLDEFRTILNKHTAIKTISWDEFLSQPPLLVFCLGVNGGGKTTTIAKLLHNLTEEQHISKSKLAVIGTDTFRAAAMDQLVQKLKHTDVDVIIPNQAVPKPTTALFQGLEIACNQGKEVILVDTSGRLHTNKNLQLELQSLISKGRTWFSDFKNVSTSLKTLLICDTTHGQSLNAQIEGFSAVHPIDAVFWSKWDCVPHKTALWELMTTCPIPSLSLGIGENANDYKYLNIPELIVDMVPHENIE